MRTARTAMREYRSRVSDLIRSGFLKLAVFAGWFALNAIVTATTADAHVKWFVDCSVSAIPSPLQTVFTTTFFQFLALFLALFSLACMAERTRFGAMLSGALDRCTAPLHRRADDLLRAAAAIFFAVLWAEGGVILTPELKAGSTSLSAIQLLIPIYLFSRATLPAAGAGIIVLYGYGIAAYGLFHMLDYPVFLGLGVWFMLSMSQNAKCLAFRFHFLRWSVALSLLWPAMEKFLYPSWVAAIAIVHPELTLGFPVATVITAAGIVEFGLSFALFWTPLVCRLAALALILLLTAATYDFGKVDGVGHLMIVTILLIVFANPECKPRRCRPALAPLVSGLALLATIFLYSGGHTLYYGSKSAALAPLMVGITLLALIALCLQKLPQVSFRLIAALSRRLTIGASRGVQRERSPRTFPTAALTGLPDGVQRRRWSTVAGFAERVSQSIAEGDGSRADPTWGLHPASYGHAQS